MNRNPRDPNQNIHDSHFSKWTIGRLERIRQTSLAYCYLNRSFVCFFKFDPLNMIVVIRIKKYDRRDPNQNIHNSQFSKWTIGRLERIRQTSLAYCYLNRSIVLLFKFDPLSTIVVIRIQILTTVTFWGGQLVDLDVFVKRHWRIVI